MSGGVPYTYIDVKLGCHTYYSLRNAVWRRGVKSDYVASMSSMKVGNPAIAQAAKHASDVANLRLVFSNLGSAANTRAHAMGYERVEFRSMPHVPARSIEPMFDGTQPKTVAMVKKDGSVVDLGTLYAMRPGGQSAKDPFALENEVAQ